MASSEYPSDAENKMKDLVKAKAPKNISQFIKIYFDIFDDIHQKLLDIQNFLNSTKYFTKIKMKKKIPKISIKIIKNIPIIITTTLIITIPIQKRVTIIKKIIPIIPTIPIPIPIITAKMQQKLAKVVAVFTVVIAN